MTEALYPDLVVNGETVPHKLIAAEAQNHEGPKDKPGVALRKAANALAVRTLLLQEARHRALEVDPLEVAPGRYETVEEALIRGLLDTEITGGIPDEGDIRHEWDRDPSRFRAPALWEVSHILCACDPREAEATETARLHALDLAAKLQKKPTAFSRLAAEHSDCGSKSSGGALGQINPGETVPEFETVLRGMAEGEITPEPVLTRHGWHLIRMDALAQGDVLPFDAVCE